MLTTSIRLRRKKSTTQKPKPQCNAICQRRWTHDKRANVSISQQPLGSWAIAIAGPPRTTDRLFSQHVLQRCHLSKFSFSYKSSLCFNNICTISSRCRARLSLSQMKSSNNCGKTRSTCAGKTSTAPSETASERARANASGVVRPVERQTNVHRHKYAHKDIAPYAHKDIAKQKHLSRQKAHGHVERSRGKKKTLLLSHRARTNA